MRCAKCNHRWRLYSHGQGFSDPPGLFFRFSLAAAALSGGLWCGREYLGWEWATLFIWATSSIAVVAMILTETAAQDQQAYGPVKCPQCEAPQGLNPWSL
jgi:hypothetical protein